jgi:predicted ArsR family transcriptional regulator
VIVTLPERRYELAGELLSSALEHAERTGDSPRASLGQLAYQLGQQLAETARSTGDGTDTRDIALQVLEAYGFEPRTEGDSVTLADCPFHTLAQAHTELVCGMNLALLDGLLDGLASPGLTAQLDPTPPYCCVRLEPKLDREV